MLSGCWGNGATQRPLGGGQECVAFLVIGVYRQNILGSLLDRGPVPLGDRLLRFIQKPVNLALESFAGHDR